MIPHELIVLLVSAMPVGELRAGIPLGLGFNLNPRLVFSLAILGNLLPVVPILILLEPVSKRLTAHSKFFDRKLGRLFEKTRRRHTERIERYGSVGLAVFVAIPSPGTGVWTGCLAAWLFDIPLRYSIPAITLGVFCSATITLAVSTGAVALFRFLRSPIVSVALAASLVLIIYLGTAFKRRGGEGRSEE